MKVLGSTQYEVPAPVIEIFNESLCYVYENVAAILLDTVESLNGKLEIPEAELLPTSVEDSYLVSKSCVAGEYIIYRASLIQSLGTICCCFRLFFKAIDG